MLWEMDQEGLKSIGIFYINIVDFKVLLYGNGQIMDCEDIQKMEKSILLMVEISEMNQMIQIFAVMDF